MRNLKKWYEAESVKELKEIGSFKDVKKVIRDDLGDSIKLNYSGWESLLESIIKLTEVIDKIRTSSCKNLYFNSEVSEIIYYLLNLDGRVRLDKLKITQKHFLDKDIAKEWKLSMAKKLHPDICKHEKATEAMSEVNKLYKEMTKNE